MQRFGNPPLPGQRYSHRPGVYAIIPQGDGILATYQAGIHNEFQLPGGGVDPGEQPIHALHREVFEETGWKISSPRVFYRFKRFVFMPDYDLWAEKICTIYVAQPVRQLCDPLEVDHTPIWLDYTTAINELVNVGDQTAVAKFCS